MIEVIKSVDGLARQKWDVLVPTMGALHAGHQSLIKLGKNLGEKVIVSIFVNPLQFENKSDLESYPKSFEQDLQFAKEAGATAVFTPSESDIYPGQIEKIEAGSVGDIFEGKSRPGHFTGVLTVVKRLFDLVQPKHAVFGEKDFQQLFLIKKMVNDLKLPVNVVAAPTIRDSSNLALSSRNSRLSVEDKKVAQVMYQALTQNNIEDARALMKKVDGFSLDYLELIDEQSFTLATPDTKNKRLIIAGWVNQVRLIDNMAMGSKR
jgi:pantoate--beta-alanine ligase